MKSRGCLASIGLLILLCAACGANWSGEGKTFELALKDGDVLCATSTVSQTTSVNDLQLTTADHLPPQVVCAHHCTSQAPCHSFNYRSDINSCHFFHYPPTVCQPQPNCQYFQPKGGVFSCQSTAAPVTTSSGADTTATNAAVADITTTLAAAATTNTGTDTTATNAAVADITTTTLAVAATTNTVTTTTTTTTPTTTTQQELTTTTTAAPITTQEEPTTTTTAAPTTTQEVTTLATSTAAVVCTFPSEDEMDCDNANKVLIQRHLRDSPANSFNRSWEEFKNGFCDSYGNFWVGNDRLRRMSHSHHRKKLYVRLTNLDGDDYNKVYGEMKVHGENQDYKTEFKNIVNSDYPGDGLSEFDGKEFSTYDQDHDSDSQNCAKKCGAGFWYNNCDNQLGNINQHKDNTCGGFFWNKPDEGMTLLKTELKLSCSSHDD